LKRIVTVLTATALMVVLMAATAAPAFAVGYAIGQCDERERDCDRVWAGTRDKNQDNQVQQEWKIWGWGSNNENFKHPTVY
jgi:Ni/Co efflux regulator RcnB